MSWRRYTSPAWSGTAADPPDKVIVDPAYTSRGARGPSCTAAAFGPSFRRSATRSRAPERRRGRPPGFEADANRGRNVVERSFAPAEQWRGLTTRCDKLAITYRAAVTFSAILTWLRNMGRHTLAATAIWGYVWDLTPYLEVPS
jgi:transposase